MYSLVLGRLAMQVVEEAADRHVGDREQPVEDDAVAAPQLAAVVGLELGLRRRQERADRVVDEGQRRRRCPAGRSRAR